MSHDKPSINYSPTKNTIDDDMMLIASKELNSSFAAPNLAGKTKRIAGLSNKKDSSFPQLDNSLKEEMSRPIRNETGMSYNRR